MAGQDNISRILGAFGSISKAFASMEIFAGDAGISKSELLALEAVSAQDGIIMGGIAGRLGIGMSTATSIIDRLIEKRLVRRERNGGDRRVVRVALTEKGKKANLAYQRQKKEMFSRMLEMLGPEEQERFVLILEKIAVSVKKGDG